MFAFVRPRALVALLMAMIGIGAVPAVAAAQQAARPVKVMTRNIYVGADLAPVIGATTGAQLATASAAVFAKIEASDPAARMNALAREIADADPMILGLQEVSLIQKDTAPPVLDGPATPAETTVFDYLDMLLGALAAGGTPYRVVTSATEASAEVPSALGFDLKLTDRDVLLAKANLPADELSWTNARSANFSTNLIIPRPTEVGGPFTFTRGYNVADFTANRRSFRLVNTHLEAFTNVIRSAQADELLGAALSSAGQKQVLLGDINSDPGESGRNPYDLLTGAGLADAWAQANPTAPGLTCCFGEDLLDPTPSVLSSRIDVVMTRNASGPASAARLYGVDPDNRTPSGRWPSDHAGVNATVSP